MLGTGGGRIQASGGQQRAHQACSCGAGRWHAGGSWQTLRRPGVHMHYPLQRRFTRKKCQVAPL